MAKNTAEVESGAGVFGNLVSGLVTRVRQAGVDIGSAFHRLAKPEGEKLLDQIAELIVLAERAASNVFSINIGGNRTTEQVVAAGNYQFVNSWITTKNFPWRKRQGKREVVLIEMGRDFTYQDALAKLVELDLEQPVYEDGLLFGEQHPDKQRENTIVFPHVPVTGAGGGPRVVYLWGRVGGRGLRLRWAGYGWSSRVRVAGVRKS